MQSIRELEVLLALCKAAPSVPSTDNANRLLSQLSPYLPESCLQAILSAPALQLLAPSPWEVLSSGLVGAVLRIGLRHPSLRDLAATPLKLYITTCAHLASSLATPQINGDGIGHGLQSPGIVEHELLRTVILTTSLLGFLDAASNNAHFWTSRERHELVVSLRAILSEKLLVAVEAALSTLRNARSSILFYKEWKQYMRQYAIAGRPLGAILLRQSFMTFVQACSSLLVAMPMDLQQHDVLAVLMSTRKFQRQRQSVEDVPMLESIANIAAREIVNLDESSDYLQMGSAWQQQMAYAVKASSLISFMCCSILNEDVADPDILISWLETALADPAQISDQTLTCTVLRTLAIMAIKSPSMASNLSRSLPNFLVQGPLPAVTASVAAECLLFVVKVLPQDTVITTLYGLGNALSTNIAVENGVSFSLFNDASLDAQYQTHINGSAKADNSASLASLHADELPNKYKSVVLAIVAIARGFQDEKITAHAWSMLVQKVGKVNRSVDLTIIAQVAVLVSEGAVPEFRAVLRLYLRLSHDGYTQRNGAILAAVSMKWRLTFNRTLTIYRWLKQECI